MGALLFMVYALIVAILFTMSVGTLISYYFAKKEEFEERQKAKIAENMAKALKRTTTNVQNFGDIFKVFDNSGKDKFGGTFNGGTANSSGSVEGSRDGSGGGEKSRSEPGEDG